jgi:dihydrolipoamide dehydrogenase
MDRECTKKYQQILAKQGIKFIMSTKVVGGKVGASGVAVDLESADGTKKQTINTDIVLVATGRRPYTEGMQLEKAGITMNKFGQVEVNDHF